MTTTKYREIEISLTSDYQFTFRHEDRQITSPSIQEARKEIDRLLEIAARAAKPIRDMPVIVSIDQPSPVVVEASISGIHRGSRNLLFKPAITQDCTAYAPSAAVRALLQELARIRIREREILVLVEPAAIKNGWFPYHGSNESEIPNVGWGHGRIEDGAAYDAATEVVRVKHAHARDQADKIEAKPDPWTLALDALRAARAVIDGPDGSLDDLEAKALVMIDTALAEAGR